MTIGALNGIRVVDLGTVIAGPYNTMQLADLGAEVIKIEEPGAADRRNLPGAGAIGYQSPDLVPVGSYRDRNKETMSLNLHNPKGLEILFQLVRTADVVTENFSPGTMDRLGIGYEVLKEINPKLVYASVSAFGQTGSYRHHRGYDILAQARTGFASVTGFPEDPPTRAGNSITDYFTGLLAAFSILAALNHADRTGIGQAIDIALFEGLFMTLEGYVERTLNDDEVPSRQGNESLTHGPACGVYEARDGNLIAIDVHRNEWWNAFCEATGQSELLTDPETANYQSRLINHAKTRRLISEWAKQYDASSAESLLASNGIPASRVLTLQEMVELPYVKDRNLYPTVDHPRAGPITLTGSPYGGLSKTPGSVFSHSPVPQEHRDSILTRVLGYSMDRINELETEGAFSV
jgi:formyl-CoA transferase